MFENISEMSRSINPKIHRHTNASSISKDSSSVPISDPHQSPSSSPPRALPLRPRLPVTKTLPRCRHLFYGEAHGWVQLAISSLIQIDLSLSSTIEPPAPPPRYMFIAPRRRQSWASYFPSTAAATETLLTSLLFSPSSNRSLSPPIVPLSLSLFWTYCNGFAPFAVCFKTGLFLESR